MDPLITPSPAPDQLITAGTHNSSIGARKHQPVKQRPCETRRAVSQQHPDGTPAPLTLTRAPPPLLPLRHLGSVRMVTKNQSLGRGHVQEPPSLNSYSYHTPLTLGLLHRCIAQPYKNHTCSTGAAPTPSNLLHQRTSTSPPFPHSFPSLLLIKKVPIPRHIFQSEG